MEERNQIHEIATRLLSSLSNGDTRWRDDVVKLTHLLDAWQRQFDDLQKKNKVLSAHVLELTQELENVRGDFGAGGAGGR